MVRERDPLTLRLCCLVAMAPALTSDLTSREKEEGHNRGGAGGTSKAAAATGKLLQELKPIADILRSDSLSMQAVLPTAPPPPDLCHTQPPPGNGITPHSRVTPISPPSPLPNITMAEMSAESAKKQKRLEGRHERLMKRLRRLQSRQSISHVKQQMTGFVSTMQRNLQVAQQDFKSQLLQGHDVKNLSTAALVSLVQQLQASSSSSSSSQSTKKQTRMDADAAAKDQLQLEEETCLELDRVAGHLQCNLRHLEKGIDSDATESSSGGESCDEMDLYEEEEWGGDPQASRPPSVTKRASYQWACHRAAIASRWTWLQAQVSDLEYRIRQQNDIFRQIRASKGAVTLQDPPPQPSTANPVSSEDAEQEKTCVAARCRPVKSYRKRKLLKTSGNLPNKAVNGRAARLSSVRCGCYPLFTACAMCGGGRTTQNSPLTVGQAEDATSMPLLERAALLDSAFHPVLSFPQDVALSLHFERLLRRGQWQQAGSKSSSSSKPLKSVQSEKRRARYNRDKAQRKYKRITKAANSSTLSAKIRSKYEQKPLLGRGNKGSSTPKGGAGRCSSSNSRRLSGSDLQRKQRKAQAKGSSASLNLHPGSSPLSNSNSSSTLREIKEAWKKRNRGENAYDINNIVIPYSVAASTRVERLKYKEIETPKWRLLKAGEKGEEEEEEEEERVSPPPKEEPVAPAEVNKEEEEMEEEEEDGEEDLSDSTFAKRHLICEVSEKKRFSIEATSSNRRSRSTNSLSQLREPEEMDQEDLGEEVPEELEAVPGSCIRRNSSASSFKEVLSRQRTPSVSSKCGMDDVAEVLPWQPRRFPLEGHDREALHQGDADSSLSAVHVRCKLNCSPLQGHHGNNDDNHLVAMVTSSDEAEAGDQDDDRNDPEWTVISEKKEQERVLPSPAIVLKLAKK